MSASNAPRRSGPFRRPFSEEQLANVQREHPELTTRRSLINYAFARLAVWTLGSPKDRIAMARGELCLPRTVLTEFGRLVAEGGEEYAKRIWWMSAGRHWQPVPDPYPARGRTGFYNVPSRLRRTYSAKGVIRLIREIRATGLDPKPRLRVEYDGAYCLLSGRFAVYSEEAVPEAWWKDGKLVVKCERLDDALAWLREDLRTAACWRGIALTMEGVMLRIENHGTRRHCEAHEIG